MNKKSTIKDEYDINKRVKLTIVNKPTIDKNTGETWYDQQVTIKIKHGYSQQRFELEDEADALAKYVENVNFETDEEEL